MIIEFFSSCKIFFGWEFLASFYTWDKYIYYNLMLAIKKGTSLIEAMVIMLIIVSWITGIYTIISSSQKISRSTSDRIKAVQIARDGIESMIHIRNTNWAVLGADRDNCWNVLDYNKDCIWDSGANYILPGSYIIYQDPNSWQTRLESKISSWNFAQQSYRDTYRVYKDRDSFYTQTGSASNEETRFTREIIISYQDTEDAGSVANEDDFKMNITSLVQWNDVTSQKSQKIEMDFMMSNWKKTSWN